MAPRASTPILSRGLDSLYVAYIAAACFFPFLIDFAAYYPVQRPHWSTDFYEWMLREINDPLFARHDAYAFLAMYTAIEAVYLVPHGIWCIRSLIRDDYMTSFHLLIWSSYMVQSCAVCAIEIYTVKDWPAEAIQKSLPGYVIFLIIAIVMFVDSVLKVRTMLLQKQKSA